MSIFTSLLSSRLATMYPIDKANHYMRGSWVAAVASSVTMVLAVWLPMWSVLALSAIAGAVCAFGVGKWKEAMDKKANEEAIAKGQPPQHGVEVADWQFTAWGAAPISFTLLVGAVMIGVVS